MKEKKTKQKINRKITDDFELSFLGSDLAGRYGGKIIQAGFNKDTCISYKFLF